jgi:hypothetical protein
MIQKIILSLFRFMTFCLILTTTATTAELVYIQRLNGYDGSVKEYDGSVKEYDTKKVD